MYVICQLSESYFPSPILVIELMTVSFEKLHMGSEMLWVEFSWCAPVPSDSSDVECVLSSHWAAMTPNDPHLSSYRQAIAFLPTAKLQSNQVYVVLIVTCIPVRDISSFGSS
jgi:hypothetical protein